MVTTLTGRLATRGRLRYATEAVGLLASTGWLPVRRHRTAARGRTRRRRLLVYPTERSRPAWLLQTPFGAHIDLNGGLVSVLYNPNATVAGSALDYSLIGAASLFCHG